MDEKWTEDVFRLAFGDVDPENLTPSDFVVAARKLMKVNPDHTKWTFGGFQRQADGRFRDEDLANALQNASVFSEVSVSCEVLILECSTAEPAAAFGARGIPAIMRVNEIMGLEQSRRWGICSLNEFRKFLGLKSKLELFSPNLFAH